jgi:predicted amidohydrolase YtcJ
MFHRLFLYLFLLLFFEKCDTRHTTADIILVNGKIVTVDNSFTILQAVAIKSGRIVAVGSTNDILKLKGDSTEIIDLSGNCVIPGIIEGHAHPIQASQSEYFEKIPDVHTISELLQWIKHETSLKPNEQWIIHPKFFITRMRDMRQLTLRELDSVSPDNPVFLDGSFGGMVNTKALKLSGLWNSKDAGILRDKTSGAPLGLIHKSVFGKLSISKENKLSDEQQTDALQHLFQIYNQMGITSVCSGGGDTSELALYERLMNAHKLTVRIFHNVIFPFQSATPDSIISRTLQIFGRKTGDGNEMVKVGALKLVLDGGVLTGTAYLREGWGKKAREIYGINDPKYRGNIFFSKKDLERFIRKAIETGWKFTAHVTGGGAVDTLLSAFEEVNHRIDISKKRFSIIHGNFFTPAAIQKMAAMGIYADMQPDWYLKDADLLNEVLGKERIASFHPYLSMINAGIVINGGSDHMVKLDPNTSINPFNPFLAIWSLVTRKTERGSVFNPEQAISREQAIKMYTINNALGSFEENLKGSIEPGKFADLAVLSHDILSCPADTIKNIKAILTMVNGKIVYKK